MKFEKYLLIESASKLYHVTFKRNLSFIKKNGITNQKMPANFGKAGQDVRDDPKAIYAFNDKTEAFLWAFKMNWEMDSKKEVIIIEFKNTGHWEKDTHWQAQTARTKGSWIRSRQIVDPKDIGKIISQKVAFDTIKKMNIAGQLH